MSAHRTVRNMIHMVTVAMISLQIPEKDFNKTKKKRWIHQSPERKLPSNGLAEGNLVHGLFPRVSEELKEASKG